MRCDLCPGQYVDKLTVMSLKRDRRTMVVEDVRARVCDLCGDKLYSQSTFSRLFALIEQNPEGVAPMYRFPAEPAMPGGDG